MNPDNAIEVHDVWKRYRTGIFRGKTLVRELQSLAARLTGREDPNEKIALGRSELHASHVDENEWFWAVSGVSFEIKKGEVVAILGRNGAGKSTLLQLICQITAADRGLIEIQGRIASLLQAGVGFHPELTGRENIFLNGTILGLTRAEIIERIPEIIEFSEIPQFIDTPVKRYSSGMQGRLGFSVTAFLGADVMIFDEAFATGDIPYRQKCLKRLRELAEQGATILVVTHMPQMLGDVCRRGILMIDGQKTLDCELNKVIEAYQRVDPDGEQVAENDSQARVVKFAIEDEQGKELEHLPVQQALQLVCRVKFLESVEGPIVRLMIRPPRVNSVLLAKETEAAEIGAATTGEEIEVRLIVPPLPLLLYEDGFVVTVVIYDQDGKRREVGRFQEVFKAIIAKPGQGPLLDLPTRWRINQESTEVVQSP